MAIQPNTAQNPPRIVRFRSPGNVIWKSWSNNTQTENDNEREKEILKSYLLSSLQMQHVTVLAGSGTSLGEVGGPSMPDLWGYCVNSPDGKLSKTAGDVITQIAFDVNEENIEALLSKCEAFLAIHPKDALVKDFVKESKATILEKCSQFIDKADEAQLKGHRTFVHRLSRRRVRDSRLKIFTTNYDLCFETAASKQALVVVDGFSYSEPRHFDPRFFNYDIVRRSRIGDESNYLEGLFHLYKLHGSVNWEYASNGKDVEINSAPDAEQACLIYPANGKYHRTYTQPHLELMSQFLAMLREPNTCLIVTGFGFNDDHLSEPILAAVKTNPHFRLIIADFSAKNQTEGANEYWQNLSKLAAEGADIWMIEASFQEFSLLIPDLKSLTPAQKLTSYIKEVASS